MQCADKLLTAELASTEVVTTLVHACQTELLQVSWSKRRSFVSKLSCDHFNQSCSAKGKI